MPLQASYEYCWKRWRYIRLPATGHGRILAGILVGMESDYDVPARRVVMPAWPRLAAVTRALGGAA